MICEQKTPTQLLLEEKVALRPLPYKNKRPEEMESSEDALKRFWSLVRKEGPVPELRPTLGQCWTWDGPRTDGYYGCIYFRKVVVLAHRIAYTESKGKIPPGLVVDHLCFNKRCVNPSHLEAVTRGVNCFRGNGDRLARQSDNSLTHCPHGHPYEGDNLVVKVYSKYTQRHCRECRRAASERPNRKRTAEAIANGRQPTSALTARGMTKTQSEWSRISGNDATLIMYRISRGWSVDDAIFKQLEQYRGGKVPKHKAFKYKNHAHTKSVVL